MGWNFKHSDDDVEFDKDIDVDIDVDLETTAYSTDTEFVYVSSDIWAVTYVDGNSADAIVDVEAVGEDTYTSLDITVLTIEDELSSISGTFTSAVE